MSPEASTYSVADPRYPWRWFIFKKRAAGTSRSRSRQAPSEGGQSRRGGADTRSLLSTCVGWLTPVSRLSVIATPLENDTNPRRQGNAHARSRSRKGRRVSLSTIDAMASPTTLHDPTELGSADVTGHTDAHTQAGAALHVTPNLRRVSYIWAQTSDSRSSDPGGLSQRPPSLSSFEAMQVALLSGRAPRHDLRHFADATHYEAEAVAFSDINILPPAPRGDPQNKFVFDIRDPEASSDDESKGDRDEEDTLCTGPDLVAESDRVIVEGDTPQAMTPSSAHKRNEATTAETKPGLQSPANRFLQELSTQDAPSPEDREQKESGQDAALADGDEVPGESDVFFCGTTERELCHPPAQQSPADHGRLRPSDIVLLPGLAVGYLNQWGFFVWMLFQCYNSACLLGTSSEWGLESFGLLQTEEEHAIKTVFNFVLFTNAASDLILMWSLYLKEYANADSEGHNFIGILKVFIAWNAVTIFLSWTAACMQVFHRYAEVRSSGDNSTSSTDPTRTTSEFPTYLAERPNPQARYFWSVLLIITLVAGVRVFVLIWFFLGYLYALEDEARASIPISPEVSTYSVADPRYPWRWFTFKKRAAGTSRSRSRQAPSEGGQSRRGGADTRSLLSTCVGWLTPVSRRSFIATPLENDTNPRRQGNAHARSRSRGGRRVSLTTVDAMASPPTLHDPTELGSADATGHMDAHTQSGAALRVIPNLERVSYIWAQTSERPPSLSSFEAMQVALLTGRAPRHDLSHFGDATLYDTDAVAFSDICILPPTSLDVSRNSGASPTRSGLASHDESKAAASVASPRAVVPSDGFDETCAADDSPERVLLKRSRFKPKYSPAHISGSQRTRPSGKQALARRLSFAEGPGLVAVSDRAVLEGDTPSAMTPPNVPKQKEAASARISPGRQSASNLSVQQLSPKEAPSPQDREQEDGSREAALAYGEEVAGEYDVFLPGQGGASFLVHPHSSLQQTAPISGPPTSYSFRAWPSGAFSITSPKAQVKDAEQQTDYS
ncbi:uncharacterized protein LOC144097965 [Amblyomma americanum]